MFSLQGVFLEKNYPLLFVYKSHLTRLKLEVSGCLTMAGVKLTYLINFTSWKVAGESFFIINLLLIYYFIYYIIHNHDLCNKGPISRFHQTQKKNPYMVIDVFKYLKNMNKLCLS